MSPPSKKRFLKLRASHCAWQQFEDKSAVFDDLHFLDKKKLLQHSDRMNKVRRNSSNVCTRDLCSDHDASRSEGDVLLPSSQSNTLRTALSSRFLQSPVTDLCKEIQLARACTTEKKCCQSISFHSESPKTATLANHKQTKTPPKMPSTTQLSAIKLPQTTPKSRSKRQVKATRLFPAPRRSPLLKDSTPILSSTVSDTLKSDCFRGNEVWCYHCGKSINLERAAKIMEHSNNLRIEDLGRTVFDLEKLSDTGCASRCMSPLEDSCFSMNGYNFSPVILKKLEKAAVTSESLVKPLQKATITDEEIEDQSVKSPCSTTIDDISIELPEPIFCGIYDEDFWQTLDPLEVEDMLQLLQLTPEQKEN